MKGEKLRIVIVYGLIVLIVFMLSFLIYNCFVSDDSLDDFSSVSDEFVVSDKCKFSVSNSEYTGFVNGNASELCGGNNLITINNITLDGEKLDVEVRYFNGEIDEDELETGVYVNGKRIVSHASPLYKRVFGVFDDKLFILSVSDVNVVVYDSNVSRLYDLNDALIKSNISDPAFVSLASSDKSLNTIVRSSIIDVDSFVFRDGYFTFDTKASVDCKAGQNIGSTYKVSYSGNDFSEPVFVNYVVCK